MKRQAFTLIELLVVIAVITILTLIATAAVTKVQNHAEMSREIAAGRNLVTAYLMYATENDGKLLPGYVADAEDVRDDAGQEVTNPANGRYPWRLAKYLPGPVKGTLLVNKQQKLTEDRTDREFYVYLVSFAPSFGMNAMYVGGNFRTSLAPTSAAFSRYGKFCATRLAEVTKPQRLMVFCSAHFNSGGEESFEGHHIIEPPNTTSFRWSGVYDEDAPAEEHGYLHLRYGNRAVAVMLDGHVELLDIEQLKDMRLWSIQAAEFDAADFVMSRH